ncbi:unnamed protein product [Blepharisma stoltei]|uniref:Tetratricopeptide repeat protein n=1 Tax=Blepharisma stoltei TaxID=1481888 RepID=A0AAU9IQM3_9CILI|nr:unnamed protein product [Blepharisma stoltei]
MDENTDIKDSSENNISELESYILELNKKAMTNLDSPKESLQFLQEAEKILLDGANPEISNMQNRLKLTSITFNNFGCYYKRTKQPNVALFYLKQAFKLEVQTYSDPAAIASTQLNICAINSQLGKHDIALNYAIQALSLLKDIENSDENLAENAVTTLIVAHYNVGVENEYLQKFDHALEHYQKGYDFALKHLGPSNQLTENLFNSLMQSSKRYGAFNVFQQTRQNKRELSRVISHSLTPSLKSRKPEILDNISRLNTGYRKTPIPKMRSRKKITPEMNLNQSYTYNPTYNPSSPIDRKRLIELGIGGTRKYLDATRRLKMYCAKIIS